MKTRILLPVVAAVLAGGPVLAQTTPTTPSATDQPAVETPTGDIIAAQEANQILADSLIGKDVVNSSGESIGEVSDILLEQDGQVVGVVIASGGVLGVGGNKIGVPWQKISYTAESDEVMLDMTKEQLAQAPKFKALDDSMMDSGMTPAEPTPAQPAPDQPATDQPMEQPTDQEAPVTPDSTTTQ